jgi:hypothetical protein
VRPGRRTKCQVRRVAVLGEQEANVATRVSNAANWAKADAFAGKVWPVLAAIRSEGILSCRAIARALNERGVPWTLAGKWQGVQVGAILKRLRGA